MDQEIGKLLDFEDLENTAMEANICLSLIVIHNQLNPSPAEPG